MKKRASRGAMSLQLSVCESQGKAPDVIQVFPAGTVRGRDGRGPWVLDNPGAVIAATMNWFGSQQMPIDYNHQSIYSEKNGRPAPAAGWITGLYEEGGALFANVEWTEAAAKAVAAREFRYISPVFYHDDAGRVTMLESCALTNSPNFDLRALCGRENIEEQNMSEDMKAVARALGLPETANGAEVAAEAARVAAEAKKEPDPSKYVPIDAHNAICKELAELKSQREEAQAKALFKEAEEAGKIAPAMRDWARAYAQSDPDGFKKWMAAAPDMRPGQGMDLDKKDPPDGKKERALDETQRAICQAMGLDEKKYAEEMKLLEGANG